MASGDLVNSNSLAANTSGAEGAKLGLQAKFQSQKDERDAALAKLLKGMEGSQALANVAAKGVADVNTEAGKQAVSLGNMPTLQGLAGSDASSVKMGEATIGSDPYAKQLGKGTQQANSFDTKVGAAYKPIHDQLDSSKSTLDYLNQNNSTADKLALINEARLSLAGSGGRGVGQMVSLLSGDPSMSQDSQKSLNWLMNTPNIPTLQPAQRDAIRESVYGRVPEIGNLHGQTMKTLNERGATLAPGSYTNLVHAQSGAAQEKLDALNKMAADYAAAKQQMAGKNISNPSVADPNPTTVDKLLGWFKGKSGSSAQANGTMRVKDLKSGQMGTIPVGEYNPSLYQQVK